MCANFNNSSTCNAKFKTINQFLKSRLEIKRNPVILCTYVSKNRAGSSGYKIYKNAPIYVYTRMAVPSNSFGIQKFMTFS
jgi:hypothetical protein